MKAKTIQIVWHSKEPVWTLDFHPSGLLATGGADKEIKLWEVKQDGADNPSVSHVGTLANHGKTVNCVRFSPTGEQLASAGDQGEVFLWKPSSGAGPAVFGADDDAPDPGWRLDHALRAGHADDVIDAAWAPDGTALLTGSIENVCVVWDTEKHRAQGRLTEHGHYVQGVAWDPAQQYVVSQSADRTCRVYGPKAAALGKRSRAQAHTGNALSKDLICQSILSRRQVPSGHEECAALVKHHLFLDESATLFSRRLAWSPDGSMLVVPAGCYKAAPEDDGVNAAYVYARGRWKVPVLALPATKPVLAARFCPKLFEPSSDAAADRRQSMLAEGNPFDLPYRMVFAVATSETVMIYDTSGQGPLAVLGGLHFEAAPITDIAWSCDGRYLGISSYDGYCSLVHFSEGELGVALPADKTPAHLQPLMEAASKTAAPATPQQSAPAKAAGTGLPHSLRSTPAGAEQPDQATGPAQPLSTELQQTEPATQGGMPGRPALAALQAPEQLPAQPAAAQEERCQGLVPLQKPSLAEEGSSKRPLTDPAMPGSAGASSAAKKQKRIMPTAMIAAPVASPVPAAPTSAPLPRVPSIKLEGEKRRICATPVPATSAVPAQQQSEPAGDATNNPARGAAATAQPDEAPGAGRGPMQPSPTSPADLPKQGTQASAEQGEVRASGAPAASASSHWSSDASPSHDGHSQAQDGETASGPQGEGVRPGSAAAAAAARAASANTSIMTTSTMRRLGLDSPGRSIEQGEGNLAGKGPRRITAQRTDAPAPAPGPAQAVASGKTAAPALGQRKSSKEFFALFKPLSQAAKPQPIGAGPTSGTDARDQSEHIKKPTQRVQTHVIDCDSD